MPPGSFESEVLTQPQSFADMLAAYAGPDSPLGRLDPVLKKAGATRSVMFLGMGSSLFASIPAQYMLALRGLPAWSVDASEYMYYRLDDPATFLPVLTSQSGESAEIKRLAEDWRGRVPYIAVTNTPDSTLGRGAAAILPILGGTEKSTTSKTYTNTLAIVTALAARVAGMDVAEALKAYAGLPAAMTALLDGWRSHLGVFADFLGDAGHIDLIGRGPSLATVGQGGLIFRELAHVKTAPLNTGLFRHGLIPSMKSGGSMIAFAPAGVTDTLTLGLVDEVVEMGGKVILVTNREVEPGPRKLVFRLPAPDGAYELHMPVLEIILIELLGILLAERRGLEPGAGIAKITAKE